MIVMPAMPPEQTASWLGVLDPYDHLGKGWTLIGGQLVHLYCAERGQFPVRPTNDVDTVIDVRADPNMLRTFTGIHQMRAGRCRARRSPLRPSASLRGAASNKPGHRKQR